MKTSIQKYDLAAPQKMQQMGKVLKEYVVKNKLFSNIKGRNYAHVEGWQFAGGLMGLFPRVREVKDLSSGQETKWMAIVDIINPQTDKVVSTGFAVCSSKEGSKKNFDEYAVLSMAQTRAIGKAYRNLIGWVMKLAGYEATPSEEMRKVGTEEPVATGAPAVFTPPQDYSCDKCGDEISKQEAEYSKKIYGKALCRVDQKVAKRK